MPAWALSGGAIGIAALVLWLALRGGGQPLAFAQPGGAPTPGDTGSGGGGGGDQGQGQPSSPYVTLDAYAGTSGSPADASAGVASSSPSMPAGTISSPSYASLVSGGQSSPFFVTPSNPGGYYIGGPSQVAAPVPFGQAAPVLTSPPPVYQPGTIVPVGTAAAA